MQNEHSILKRSMWRVRTLIGVLELIDSFDFPLRLFISMLAEGVKTAIRHYKAGNINWPLAIYISLVHVAGIIGLTYVPLCSKGTLLWAFMLWPITKLGITAGAHRLWSHHSYKAVLPLRIFLMLAASIANQGSIWHWCRDHRVHHKHTEVRPYCN